MLIRLKKVWLLMPVIAVFAITFAVVAAEPKADVSVTVSLNGEMAAKPVYFPAGTRLAEVLAADGLSQHWYWPASKVYKLNSPAAARLKQQAHDEVTVLLSSASVKERAFLTNFRHQITQWTLAERQPVKMNYDVARLNPEHNPGFAAGEYLLQLVTRPNNIHVFGAVTEQPLPLIPGSDVRDYVNSIDLPPMASRQYVYLLQADGRLISVNLLERASNPIEAMPGSILIIPFHASVMRSRYKAINALLVDVALHRVW